MAEIISLDAVKEQRRKRFIEMAAQIAQEIDPKAGGFFRRCLERAAILGMEAEARESDATEQPK